MSCYIVASETISRVVSTLWDATRHNAGLPYTGYEWLKLLMVETDLDAQALGDALLQMNREAFAARYGADALASDDLEFGVQEYRWSYTLQRDRCARLKSIKCLLYQCSEGAVPELSLYQALREYAHALATDIVSDLPEYELAQWE